MKIKQVTTFESDDITDLAIKVNKFIEDTILKVVDIKYQVYAVPEYPPQYSAMICLK